MESRNSVSFYLWALSTSNTILKTGHIQSIELVEESMTADMHAPCKAAHPNFMSKKWASQLSHLTSPIVTKIFNSESNVNIYSDIYCGA